MSTGGGIRPFAARAALTGLLVIAGLVVSGCASDPWDRYETSVYDALRNPGREGYERHAELLQELIDRAEEAGVPPRPGIRLEHALYLTRLGRPDDARRQVEAEALDYPAAKKFTGVVTRFLAGERLSEAPPLLEPEAEKKADPAPKDDGAAPEQKGGAR